METSPLPFQPLAIALASVKYAKNNREVRMHGIDLESGRCVKVKVQYDSRSPAKLNPRSHLVVLLSL